MDVRDQLLHRFFPNGDVLRDFATISLQMDPVNQQEMTRRDFVGGKGKSARRDERAIWFPHFDPGTQRWETAGNCNLLSDVLTFPRRKVGNNINFEPGKRRDRRSEERRVGKSVDIGYRR